MHDRPNAAAEPPSFLAECWQSWLLALPLMAGQIGQMLMGVVDTVMVGQLGVVPLGAAAFANALISIPWLLGIGLLSAVSVRVAQARGANDPLSASEALRHGTWLALAFALASLGLTWLGLPCLHLLGQPAEVVQEASRFLILLAVSLIPGMISMAWKNHADSLLRPWPPFWILFGGVLLNVFLNWLLVFGHWGFPKLGLAGAGWATLIARLVVALGLGVWLTGSDLGRIWTPSRWSAPLQRTTFLRLLALGLPASLQLLTEVTAFASASLLIGKLGALSLAAHQIAITCSTTAFMFPLGLSMAVTVRVGDALGAGQRNRLRPVLLGGWLFAFGTTFCSMILFVSAGAWLAGCFVSDPAVIKIAAGLLLVAGVFQLVDGAQVVAAGALRGVNDVKVPALLAMLCYWGIALPAGAILGLCGPFGAAGVWIGLAAGLSVASVTLGVRAWRKLHPVG